MILVDTSVWAEHFRRGRADLSDSLVRGTVVSHEFILGELALGFVRRESVRMDLLSTLPVIPTATHAEAMNVVRQHSLEGSGIGWLDAHLLASAVISGVPLWTIDHALASAARKAGVSAI